MDAAIGFEASKVIRQGYKSWAKKVEAGKEIRGNQMMPEGLLGEILLGPDKETGLVGTAQKERHYSKQRNFYIRLSYRCNTCDA